MRAGLAAFLSEWTRVLRALALVALELGACGDSARAGMDAGRLDGGARDGAIARDATTADAGSGDPGTPGVVSCPSGDCVLGREACCSTEDLSLDGPYACEPVETALMCGQNITCDGPEDCTTGPCCTYYAQPGRFFAACWPDFETACIRPVCHVDADCPSTAPNCCVLSGHGSLRKCTEEPCT
jgi:hypothetical protein